MEMQVPDHQIEGLFHKMEKVLLKRDRESLASAEGRQSLLHLLTLLAQPNEAVVCHQYPPPYASGCHFECLCCSSLKDAGKRAAFRSVQRTLSHFKNRKHKTNVQRLDPDCLVFEKAHVHHCEYLCSSYYRLSTVN
jgi:hypothetical protein